MALAFAVLAFGAVLAIGGVLTVLLGDTVFDLARPSWIREVGFAAAAAGLPVFLAGLSTALPSRWWERSLLAVGVLASGVGVGLFVLWYPDQWYLSVQAPNGYAIGSYLMGVSFLAAATAGCLGEYLSERLQGGEAKAGQARKAPTDAEIQADLAWAERQGWSWGGVREDKVDVELRLTEDLEGVQMKGLGKQFVETVEAGEGDERSARSLATLRGIQPTGKDEAVEDQVGQLKALRQKKRDEEQGKRSSWRWRLMHPIQWLKGSGS